MTVRMSQQQDRLFGMIHLLTGEAWPVFIDESDGVFAWNIFRAHHNEFIPWDAVTEFDLQDASARNAAAYRSPKDHIGKRDVVDVLRSAAHLRQALFTKYRRSDDSLLLQAISRRPAAVRLFWRNGRNPPLKFPYVTTGGAHSKDGFGHAIAQRTSLPPHGTANDPSAKTCFPRSQVAMTLPCSFSPR